ncbi:hydrogenase maturation nickel metallochaperone HypA [Vulcanococcus sp. DEBay_Sum29NL08_54]|uniref:hydrogenase maturation nickel metallochaperone HypA/HybF n=1 Tax=Vulcanococcus sp. DEBay_Sum29NL08_54 TaxID=2806303 RepID=UPI0025FD691A|nr:hydrogenase maturation nickel metallochaperone HypA [Vulcanococcus sp. DEBay_Sum29NL08_54]
MHELALIDELCRIAQQAARDQGASTIHSLLLRIGNLSGVDAEALRQAFAVVATAPPWSSTRLELEVVKTRCFCAHCRQAFRPTDLIHQCSRCGALSSDVLEGRELELVSMEVS